MTGQAQTLSRAGHLAAKGVRCWSESRLHGRLHGQSPTRLRWYVTCPVGLPGSGVTLILDVTYLDMVP